VTARSRRPVEPLVDPGSATAEGAAHFAREVVGSGVDQAVAAVRGADSAVVFCLPRVAGRLRSRIVPDQTGWFTRERYGGPSEIAGFVGVFGLLFCFVGFTVFDRSDLMSNDCIGDFGQMVCPSNGPDWARPLPAALALLGLLTGLVGLLAGRPVRTPALVTGFVLTAVGLGCGWLLSPT
jgi:hypothetical protein